MMDTQTWSRIQQEILRRHPFARAYDGEVRLVLVLDATRVGVRVRPVSEGALEVLAEVGDLRALEPWEALRLNAQLPAGALALVGTTYVIRAVVDERDAPDGLDGDGLQRRTQRLAGVAAAIKGRVRRPVDPAPFLSYVD
jgi:hypothetical protein